MTRRSIHRVPETAAPGGLLLAILLALLPSSAASGPASLGSMGIDERLGASVPLDLTLTDESGRPVRLGSLIDRPTILTLNYFTCTGLCTPQLNGIADLVDRIGLEPGKDFRVLTVSFDPHDTPEIAARKRENLFKILKRPMRPSGWRFLTGDAASTKRLADSVGYEFQEVQDAYVHPGVIIVLTPQGRVSRYILGVQFVPADVQMALSQAAEGLSRPTIPQFPQTCSTSEPPGRNVGQRVIRIGGLATLAGIGLVFGGIALWGRDRKKGAQQ